MFEVRTQAEEDGVATRRAGEPLDPTPYLARYDEWRGAQRPAALWLIGWDAEDERHAFEASRPTVAGEVEWRPVKRQRDGGT